MVLGSVLVSQGRCNKSSPTLWLKTTEVCSHTFLEARSHSSLHGAEIKVSAAVLPPVALEKNRFLASSSSWWLPELLGHVTAISASVFTGLLLRVPALTLPLCPSCKDTGDGELGPPR